MRQPVVYGGTFNKPCQRNRDKSDLVALEIRFTERETELGVIIKGERESERKGASIEGREKLTTKFDIA